MTGATASSRRFPKLHLSLYPRQRCGKSGAGSYPAGQRICAGERGGVYRACPGKIGVTAGGGGNEKQISERVFADWEYPLRHKRRHFITVEIAFNLKILISNTQSKEAAQIRGNTSKSERSFKRFTSIVFVQKLAILFRQFYPILTLQISYLFCNICSIKFGN